MKEQMLSLIEQNGPLQWLIVTALAMALACVIKLALNFVEARWEKFAKRTVSRLDDIFVGCLQQTKSWVIFIWVFNPLSQLIAGSPGLHRFIFVMTVIFSSLQVALWGLYVIRNWRETYLKEKISHDSGSASAINLMGTAIQSLFIIALFLICLSNLGVDIGALVAGLGIGGVAVALAAQNILGDLFGSLSIVLDKPFVVGDYIVINADFQGTVENIGVKTTRVRSLSGEELIFSNKDLLESRVKNFKRMWERRVVLTASVPFSTPLEKVQMIPRWMKAFVDANPLLRFERSHMAGYGKYSFDFETVYWVKDPDTIKHMDLQQEIFHKMIQTFRENHVEFAVPAQKSILSEDVVPAGASTTPSRGEPGPYTTPHPSSDLPNPS